MIDYSQLQSRGFLIIPSFLCLENLTRLQKDYQSVKDSTHEFKNKNYQILLTSQHGLEDVISSTINRVAEHTDIQVDSISRGATYFDNSLIDFTWHQDHEPYFLQQESYHGLNFWIPIIKQDALTSGVSVIPFDRLPEKVRGTLVGKGAKQFTCHAINNTTTVVDDASGKQTILDINLDHIAESPELQPGDLLLMRQDTIHRTQVGIAPRVAVSIRCYNGNSVLSRSWFFGGSFRKQMMISNNESLFKTIAEKFKRENTSSFQLKTILEDLRKK
jgi:hypothetical protein